MCKLQQQIIPLLLDIFTSITAIVQDLKDIGANYSGNIQGKLDDEWNNEIQNIAINIHRVWNPVESGHTIFSGFTSDTLSIKLNWK